VDIHGTVTVMDVLLPEDEMFMLWFTLWATVTALVVLFCMTL